MDQLFIKAGIEYKNSETTDKKIEVVLGTTVEIGALLVADVCIETGVCIQKSFLGIWLCQFFRELYRKCK